MRPLASPVAAITIAGALFAFRPAFAAGLPVADAAFPPEYPTLLKSYVSTDGVRYRAWKRDAKDAAALSGVTAFYAGTRPPAERSMALAWHLNAYNAWILARILEAYPTGGPLEADPDFFRREGIVISGTKMSFDHLEQKIIRPRFGEPRIHFALNCASASCPPLAAEPFDGPVLDRQLEGLTRAFLNANPLALKPEGSAVALSKIFDWYKADFAAAGGVIGFINRYRDERLPAGAKIRFLDYDWTLNEAR